MSKIKVQSNASGTGVFTVTSPATNTDRTITLPDGTGTLQTTADTITSSRLSGALPALDGSSLTNLPAGGVDGISSASSSGTAIKIISDNKVTIGSSGTPNKFLTLFPPEEAGIRRIDYHLYDPGTDNTFVSSAYHTNGTLREIGLVGSPVRFYTGAQSGSTSTKQLEITSDGRGLSQFTAKAWCSWEQTGTQGINSSHNVSSVTDLGVGKTQINFQNSMANIHYAASHSGKPYGSWGGNTNAGSHGTASMSSYHLENGTYVDSAVMTIMVFGD